MKTIRWILATYLPMPSLLAEAIEDGRVRTSVNEERGTAYFIGPRVADKASIRRAIAQRKMWELLAVCALGISIGMATAGVHAAFGGICPSCRETVLALNGDQDAVADAMIALQDAMGSDGKLGMQSHAGEHIPFND